MVTRVIQSLRQTPECVLIQSCSRSFHIMPKPKKQNSTEKKTTVSSDSADEAVVCDVKRKVVTIRVLAKPGAKHNAITGIGSDGVGVQIAAPPVDGEANTELIKYLSKVLGLRKSDLSLDRGSKSRNKMVMVHASMSVEDILSKLQSERENG